MTQIAGLAVALAVALSLSFTPLQTRLSSSEGLCSVPSAVWRWWSSGGCSQSLSLFRSCVPFLSNEGCGTEDAGGKKRNPEYSVVADHTIRADPCSVLNHAIITFSPLKAFRSFLQKDVMLK